jgi:hypothetical protein
VPRRQGRRPATSMDTCQYAIFLISPNEKIVKRGPMRLNRMRIAVWLSALATIAGTAAPAASAATTHAALPATPATSTTSCGASNVWLKVWGGTGEHCYTGNGSLAVTLPSVHEAQVLGSHEACLYSLLDETCGTGPDVLFIDPAINVTRITLLSF